MCVYALVVLIMWRIRSRQREREREREMCVCKCVYCFLDKKSVPRWRSGSSPCDNRRYWSQFYRAHSYIRRPHLYTWTRSLNMIRSETLIQCRVCCRNWVRHWSYNTCQSMVQYDSCSCVEDALQLVCCLLRPTDSNAAGDNKHMHQCGDGVVVEGMSMRRSCRNRKKHLAMSEVMSLSSNKLSEHWYQTLVVSTRITSDAWRQAHE